MQGPRSAAAVCLVAALRAAAPSAAPRAPASNPATPPARGAVEARIKIDLDRTIGTVDPLLFGNFAEHLGRMIYGGIYEEGSPLSDANGFRTDVMEAVRGLGVSILRWPRGHTYGDDRKVRPVTYTFPAHSLTILTFTLTER